ncbi:MAG TPA: metallophosphoesterase [Thermoanaerobaculia bacterium]|nr:metallophosphoesterase [Thermoanaerobaculia bacterium]
MLLRALFLILILLALLGDARIFLFVLNRFVFGSHRHEKSPWTWMMWVIPPLLLVLTALFWPLHRWIDWMLRTEAVERLTPEMIDRVDWDAALGRAGMAWLLIAASVGLYWIIDTIRLRIIRERPPGRVRTLPADVVRLRRAHVPFAWLRRLGAHNDVYDLEITRHEVDIDGLPAPFDGYRIAFLTDTHVAGFVRRSFYEEVVAQTNRFEPDLILLGGDFVTWNRHIPLMAEALLAGLRARDGIFAVLGNHDYWAGGEEVKAALAARGVELVINRSVRLRRDGAELPLAGVDEIYRGEPDLEAAFADVPPGPCLGLTHHPDLIGEMGSRRLDLLVCGHTHGGQIRVPFFGAIVVPSRYEAKYASGFHRVGNVLMYVSRGIGAIPPLRILCRPEIATFVLRRGAPTE